MRGETNLADISGFYFFESESDFKPDDDLAAFLASGDAPVYIGFGSVVVEDPTAMTKTILEAVEKAGVRALVSAGWGGLGGVDVPDSVFILKGESSLSTSSHTQGASRTIGYSQMTAFLQCVTMAERVLQRSDSVMVYPLSSCHFSETSNSGET